MASKCKAVLIVLSRNRLKERALLMGIVSSKISQKSKRGESPAKKHKTRSINRPNTMQKVILKMNISTLMISTWITMMRKFLTSSSCIYRWSFAKERLYSTSVRLTRSGKTKLRSGRSSNKYSKHCIISKTGESCTGI